MSTSLLGTMKDPRLKIPLLLLVLVLTGKAFCNKEEVLPSGNPDVRRTTLGGDGDAEHQDSVGSSTLSPIIAAVNSSDLEAAEGSTGDHVSVDSIEATREGFLNSTNSSGDNKDLDPILILVPVVLAVVILSAIVCGICIHRKCNQNSSNRDLSKDDPDLEESSTEKVPMPMFEEDVPSVLELEMDELDQWMKKDT